jgi:hypothetical protein
MPHKRSNPDIRTGSKGDPSPWIPSRVYAYLCDCFRRPSGCLALTEREFEAACQEYLRRAVPAYFRPKFGTNRRTTAKQEPKRKYVRQKRTGVLDATPTSRRNTLIRISRAEFPRIILKGEFRSLKKQVPDEEQRLNILRQRYSYLDQLKEKNDTLIGDLKDMPYKLAYQEVAEELGIKPDSLERMLKPSYQRRAGTPAWLSEMSARPSKESAREALRKARIAWAGFKGKI